MTESHPIPEIAKTALGLLRQQFQQGMNAIAQQAVEARGLDPALNWNVNFDTGKISREVPKPQKPPHPSPETRKK